MRVFKPFRFAGVLLFALPLMCWATARLEITKSDFTKAERIRSNSVEVFGVGLGDPFDESMKKFEHAGLVVESVNAVQYRAFDSRHSELLAVDGVDGRIIKISLFQNVSRFLVGDAKRLYDPSITEPDSPVRLSILGREDQRTVEENSIGRIVTCSYDREGIRVIRSFSKYGDAAPVLHLVQPARER